MSVYYAELYPHTDLQITRDQELAILAINPSVDFPELQENTIASKTHQTILWSKYVLPTTIISKGMIECKNLFTIPVMVYYISQKITHDVQWYLTNIEEEDNLKFLHEAQKLGCKLTPNQKMLLKQS